MVRIHMERKLRSYGRHPRVRLSSPRARPYMVAQHNRYHHPDGGSRLPAEVALYAVVRSERKAWRVTVNKLSLMRTTPIRQIVEDCKYTNG